MNSKLFFIHTQTCDLGLSHASEVKKKKSTSITLWFYVTKALALYLSMYLGRPKEGSSSWAEPLYLILAYFMTEYVFCFKMDSWPLSIQNLCWGGEHIDSYVKSCELLGLYVQRAIPS